VEESWTKLSNKRRICCHGSACPSLWDYLYAGVCLPAMPAHGRAQAFSLDIKLLQCSVSGKLVIIRAQSMSQVAR